MEQNPFPGVAIVLGIAGIMIPIFNLMGNGRPEVMTGIMISGSIVFGSGIIAMAIVQKK